MRIVFNIGVGADVPSFVQAGEILDKITRDLNETLEGKGTYDIAQFQMRHSSVRKYPSEEGAMMAETPDPDTDRVR